MLRYQLLFCLSNHLAHNIAASADIPFAIWLNFNAFVSSIGHFSHCFTLGNQYPQLDSSFVKHFSHSVALRLSCLCVSSFAKLNRKSTQNNNACLLSGFSITKSLKLLLDTTASFTSTLSFKSIINVWSFSQVWVHYPNRDSTRTNLQIFWFEFHQFLVLLCVSFFKHICHSRMLHLVPFFLSAFHLFR